MSSSARFIFHGLMMTLASRVPSITARLAGPKKLLSSMCLRACFGETLMSRGMLEEPLVLLLLSGWFNTESCPQALLFPHHGYKATWSS